MSRHVNAISGRLSLRPPQRRSLEILAHVAGMISLDKGADLQQALETIRAEYPSVEDFEREFPSLCFALATGVGKTRLMGAFVAYLHLAQGVQHFFVLAPNLTIYNKLIADFTPGTRKYVLNGIAEFAQDPPEIITGDNYEYGRGIRKPTLFGEAGVHINIFNISKINTEVRGGAAPRIKRLSEYIGESYFAYLAGLDDLVLIMDESHRYRASAGIRAINELKPILGLELTATPFTEAASGQKWFKNIIYSYPLSAALEDGFVKEPAVATRENFNPKDYSAAELERLKLEDGVRVHEAVKVELEVYARQTDRPVVKPFMLVVAQDTDHANSLVATIKSEPFFEGIYKDRVITVHSNQRGEERDDTVQRLLAVESPAEPTEIVVHVNMLKEGWDVTNLYTIVPLRAASARTLVEQSIGRGLRLPYGRRTGIPAVDRLTIVAHDRFQEIIDEAKNPGSIIRTGVIIGRDIPLERRTPVEVAPLVDVALSGKPAPDSGQPRLVFDTPAEQGAARETLKAINHFASLPGSSDLRSPEVQSRIGEIVRAACVVGPASLPGTVEEPDIPSIVAKVTDLFIDLTIDIPRIIIVPRGEVTSGYRDFDLDVSRIALQPVAKEILIQHLASDERYRIFTEAGIVPESRPEDYLVSALIDYNDICYDTDAALLYKLAAQVVTRLRSYLPDEDAVENVLQYHRKPLAAYIHGQMQPHFSQSATSYEAVVSRGFTPLKPCTYTLAAGDTPRNFRTPVATKQDIPGMLFEGFHRCVYPIQRFQSDTERLLAVILEDHADARLKWVKPGPGAFQIHYRADRDYEPDFVVETSDRKYILEPKRAGDMNDEDVQDKARAAVQRCQHATRHELHHRGKPWSYLLIPEHAILPNATLAGLASQFTVAATA